MFTLGSMDVFLMRTIVPKLTACLDEFPINPQKQELGEKQNKSVW